jgi:hypothetical protein
MCPYHGWLKNGQGTLGEEGADAPLPPTAPPAGTAHTAPLRHRHGTRPHAHGTRGPCCHPPRGSLLFLARLPYLCGSSFGRGWPGRRTALSRYRRRSLEHGRTRSSRSSARGAPLSSLARPGAACWDYPCRSCPGRDLACTQGAPLKLSQLRHPYPVCSCLS